MLNEFEILDDTRLKKHFDNVNNKLNFIRDKVRNLWKRRTGPPWYTFHNASHSEKVEEMLYELIPTGNPVNFSPEEWFHLVASAWLHDIGMILNLFGKDEDFEEVRETHDIRSARYITENRKDIDLDIYEAEHIAEICMYHRKKYDIADCIEKVGDIRKRLLAAYLRLADAIHIDATRVDEGMYNLLVSTGMPWESRFHWLKSMWVQSIRPDPSNNIICVSVSDVPESSPKKGLLPRLVYDEIYEELNSVKEVLILGKISYFLDIKLEPTEIKLNLEVCNELEELLCNIELESTGSASQAAERVINNIIRMTERDIDSYQAIQTYKRQIENVFKARQCHILIKKVLEIIQDAMQDKELSEDERRARVNKIKAGLVAFKETRDANISALVKNAKPFLLDYGSILLFGYSIMVLKVLESLSSNVKQKTPIYIAECRGKTQYNHDNEIIYCDGLTYANDVSELEFTNITIIPDICIGNLMARGLISKTILGANGIDLSGKSGHTVGHLAIVDLAKLYKVPVYVIADTAKFGKVRWNAELERDVHWLAGDRKTLAQLEQKNIRMMNPREDILDLNKIDMLITEIGVFPPTRIPSFLREI